jgi:hypothetical protein
VLDLDLWHTTTVGPSDRFDERRFGVWLETLMEEGEAVAARIVAAMDSHLAILGFSRYVRVFDPGVLSSVASSEDGLERVDGATSGNLECEIGGYTVRAKTAQAWDAVVGLLVTLAAEHSDCFHALMQGCRRLSNSTPEADGFHQLMLEPEQLLYDVSTGREHRRTEQGYLTAGDARAFLQVAKLARPSWPNASSSISAIVASYFRALEEAQESARQRGPAGERSAGPPIDPEVSEAVDAIVGLLAAEPAVASARPRALLGPGPADEGRVTPIEPLMEYLRDTDQVAYFARNRELTFLANALLAGSSVYSRALTVREAWTAAVGVCNLGFEVWAENWHASGASADTQSASAGTMLPDMFLVDHDVVTAFEAGWRLLHEDVSMFVTEHLIWAIADLGSIDSAIQRDLQLLQRELELHRDVGAPWRAQGALEVIGILDMPTWACLSGLLSECPVLPAALKAILEGHAGSVSATAFECFATGGQIRKVHEFAERLREILLRP